MATTYRKKRKGMYAFTCYECQQSFKKESILDEHTKYLHTRDGYREIRARVMCAYCVQFFIDPCDLKRHMNAVHRNKRYPCPACPKNFAYSYHVNEHLKKVHAVDQTTAPERSEQMNTDDTKSTSYDDDDIDIKQEEVDRKEASDTLIDGCDSSVLINPNDVIYSFLIKKEEDNVV